MLNNGVRGWRGGGGHVYWGKILLMFLLCDSIAAVEDFARLEAFVDLILVARPPGSESAAEVLSLAYQHSFSNHALLESGE